MDCRTALDIGKAAHHGQVLRMYQKVTLLVMKYAGVPLEKNSLFRQSKDIKNVICCCVSPFEDAALA